MTCRKATSIDYYLSSGGVASGMESYYLDAVTEGEPPGMWTGAGAAELGLTGEIDAEDMKTLYGEFVNPVTGERFGTRPAKRRSVEARLAEKLAAEPDASPERVEEVRKQTRPQNTVIGWDATLAVPKSVTAVHTAAHRGELAALREGDQERAGRFAFIRTQIEEAVLEANAAGIAKAEEVATARAGGGPGGALRWEKARGLVVASFFQHTNRSIDPHLHVHNVILNRVVCADGKVRALDGQDLLDQRFWFSAASDRTLTESLVRRLGLAMRDRPDGAGREVAMVPQPVIEHFSTRKQQMNAAATPLVEAFVEKYGRDPTEAEMFRLKTTASRSSRARKTHQGESAAEMNERWMVELVVETGLSMDSLANRLDTAVSAHLARQADPDATTVPAVEWSARTVIAEAVAACSARSATWGRANLISELELHLPVLGIDTADIPALLEGLADEALAGADVVQVAGMDTGVYAAPSATLYATTGTLAAESGLRRAGVERSGVSVPAGQVSAWLKENYGSLWPDQQAAVTGIASSDAAVSILLGPAGTGKSYAAGALAAVWADLTADSEAGPGRVVGLAVSDRATQVLADDGISAAANVAAWLAAQDRLREGSTRPEDAAWRLSGADVVMIDEASMVSTEALSQVRALVQEAGARLVLTGDPRQLGAIEAGGVMDLLTGRAETYALTDVRRFAAEWERAASLGLREGSAEALAEYDRHGRLMDYDSVQDATEAAARAAVADRLDGRSVVVVTPTNAQAAAVAAQVRDQLISLGLVQGEGGVITGRDQNTASIGDVITCRHKDRGLGVTNQVQYQVLDTAANHPPTDTSPEGDREVSSQVSSHHDADEGWLLVQEVTDPDKPPAAAVRLPGAYVGQHVQLGYASTVHSAQGLTVDATHLVTGGTGPGMDAAGVYVAMTRGRLRNTAHVALTKPADTDSAPAASTPAGGEVRFSDTSTRISAREVLAASLTADPAEGARLPQRPGPGVSATVAAERAAAHESSMATLTARVDAEVRQVCRTRTETHLDDLVAEGVLDEGTRARLAADQGTEYLARVIRATEQAGHDPRQVLTDAITATAARKKGFSDAKSVAQVLSHRITQQHPTTHPTDTGPLIPAGIPQADADRLTRLHQHVADRTQQLGQDIAAAAPEWATRALGPVPELTDTADRADWEHRAGIVAAHREAVGFDHPTQALDRMPAILTTERRASFVQAWEVLGQPETGLSEADMSDGQLRNRITAWQREQEWAPPYADAHLRDAETTAEEARHAGILAERAAVLAEEAGAHDEAERLREEAETYRTTAVIKTEVAEQYTRMVEVRNQWAAATIGTRTAYERALPEAGRRNLAPPGQEPGRTTTHDWLAEARQQEADLDRDRPITETDLDLVPADEAAWAAATYHDPHTPTPSEYAEPDTRTVDSPQPTPLELQTMIVGMRSAVSRLAERTSQDTAYQAVEAEQAAIESWEAGLRRREAADLTSTGQPPVRDLGIEVGALGD